MFQSRFVKIDEFGLWDLEIILADEGKQFTSTEFKEEFQTCGVHLELAAPEHQEMNGQVVVAWRTLCTILVYWEILKDNLADYFTKHNPTKHHRYIRGTYLFPTSNSSKYACYQVPSDLRECVKSPPRPGNGQQTYKVSSSYKWKKYGRIGYKVQTAISK